MGQDLRHHPHSALPGIQISAGPAMLDFIDSSFVALDMRYSIFLNSLENRESRNTSAKHHCELFSASLRKYLKLLIAYVYTPVRGRLNKTMLDSTFLPIESDAIETIEELALVIYQIKLNDFRRSQDSINSLHRTFSALKTHHDKQKKILYPLYIDLWDQNKK